ncbi:MAG: 30S ribosomal protein S8e [archaeon]
MALTSDRPKRKATGGRYVAFRKKTISNTRSMPTLTKLSEKKKVVVRTKGGHAKTRLYSADTANVFDPKTKKSYKLKIKNITGNLANRHFIRQNIITKGAVIDTEKGKAKVTSRPGQEGTINAILI